MIGSFDPDPRWLVGTLLVVGTALIVLLGRLLARPRTLAAWTEEIGGLAWTVARHVRRVFVALAAGTLILAGIAMLVLPGPGMLVLAAALGLLATEFVWARRWLKELQQRAAGVGEGARGLFIGRRRRGPREHETADPRTEGPQRR